MFRIRRIFDVISDVNRDAVRQVQGILREQFPLLKQETVDEVPDQLAQPFKHKFHSMLYVAEDHHGKVRGFALVNHDPALKFCFLDYISAVKAGTGGGIGGALYERVRAEARLLGAKGVFFECLPDDPVLCKDPETLKQNKARLKFYEKYGALPIVNTAYETPVKPDEDNPPYLVFDGLGAGEPLGLAHAKAIVRAILERKYVTVCTPEYNALVLASFKDDPVKLRAPRYVKTATPPFAEVPDRLRRIVLAVNDRHDIHHVRERGYVESPVRIRAIQQEIEKTGLFEPVRPEDYPERHLLAVHDAGYLEYLKRVCKTLQEGSSVYPYVFPIRNLARPPKELAVRAGYYCIDTFTPINVNAYLAAKRAVDCALTCADRILVGYRLAYALVRPPGHHAERRSFGGFCYFNNGAVAAHYLSRFGKVAILDLDYHHGNGQQAIFYDRDNVLTVSIHGHPSFAYPYFSGFEEETGEGPGEGFCVNIPLQETLNGETYHKALGRAIHRVKGFAPSYLIVCLGLDTAKGDPTGTWRLGGEDFERVGRRVGEMGIPSLVVQEGGYRTRSIGVNARRFFTGLWSGMFGAPKEPVKP